MAIQRDFHSQSTKSHTKSVYKPWKLPFLFSWFRRFKKKEKNSKSFGNMKMGPKSSSLLSLALLLAFSSTIQAFDITKLLGQYPDLGLFNQYLTETKLADQINARKTITILAIGNSAISSISGKSKDVLKAILSTHVILDYYDEKKIMSIQGTNNTQLTTLYQASGNANKLQGFLNVSFVGEGEIVFGSAVKGAPMNAKLVKTVTTQPYDISVLQVSEPIIAPGIDASAGAKTPAPAPPAKTPAPSKAPKNPTPSTAPQSPEKADAPVKTPPASSPEGTRADKAADDESSSASTPTPAGSASPSSVHMGVVGAVMGLASLLF